MIFRQSLPGLCLFIGEKGDCGTMYELLTGPVLWITFSIFLGGLVVRIVFLYRLSRKKDQIFYDHVSFSWGFKSILHWLVPWGSASMRNQPVFTFAVFVFHLALLAVPLFLNAHNVLWDEAFGLSLWSMPDVIADALTVIMLASVAFLFIRRIVRHEVRILTSAWDYILLFLTVAPFLSGFLAYHQLGPYESFMILHIIFGEILLIIIPFSKLGHMILFFFARAFIGFEMGGRRGARSW
jgi:nitrate reductase gamma subunit